VITYGRFWVIAEACGESRCDVTCETE